MGPNFEACSSIEIVYAKMTLESLRTAFVIARQACTAILAVTPLIKKYKTYANSVGLLVRTLKNQLLRESA